MEFLMRRNMTVFAYLDDLFHSKSDELYKSYERTNQRAQCYIFWTVAFSLTHLLCTKAISAMSFVIKWNLMAYNSLEAVLKIAI